MHKSILLPLAMSAALAGSALALAAPGMGGGQGWHGHHGMDMGIQQLGKLGLTDTQRASIKQMATQSFAQMKTQMQNLRQQRSAFESMDPTSSGYQTATNNLADAEASVARARVIQRAALRAQIFGILTPAQRTQVAGMRAQRQARMQQWKEFKAQHPLPTSNASSQ